MKSMKTRGLRRLLAALGCVQAGGKGSHEKWTAPGGHSTVIKAGEKNQKPGTLRNIQRDLAPEFGSDWIDKEQA